MGGAHVGEAHVGGAHFLYITCTIMQDTHLIPPHLREVYDMSLRAFVSFVHFYYKHECKLIFQHKGELCCGTLTTPFDMANLPHTHIHVYIHTHKYTHAHTCTHIYIHTHIHYDLATHN